MADIMELTEDLAIIQKLGDNPNTDDGLSAAELKAKFDAAPLAIKKYINDVLVPALKAAAVQAYVDENFRPNTWMPTLTDIHAAADGLFNESKYASTNDEIRAAILEFITQTPSSTYVKHGILAVTATGLELTAGNWAIEVIRTSTAVARVIATKGSATISCHWNGGDALSEWKDDRYRVRIVTTTGTDLNDYTEEGVYFFNAAYVPTNIPFGSNGWLEVIPSGDGRVKQIWHRLGTPGSNDHQTAVRTYSSNTGWGAWSKLLTEKDIPLMIAGNEYLTMERWSGKDVYAKLITIGYVAAGDNIFEHKTGVYTPISVDVMNNSQDWLNGSNLITNLSVNRTNIYFNCTSNFGNIQLVMKYTKE